MTKQPTTDDWPVARGWTLSCSRCREEGQTYEDTEGPEHAISLFEERGWTLEWDTDINPLAWQLIDKTPPEGVWRAYCPRCNEMQVENETRRTNA